VGCAFHKIGICGVGLLEPRQLVHQRFVKRERYRVPSAVRHEAAVKDVKTAQALDAEMRAKKILQFAGGKGVKAHGNTASVTKLDLAPVPTMVEFEVSGRFDRIDKHGGRAADCAHGADEVALGHPSELGCDSREVRDRQMVENAKRRTMFISDPHGGTTYLMTASKQAHQRCKSEESRHFIPGRQESSVDVVVLKQRSDPGEYAIPEAEDRYRL